MKIQLLILTFLGVLLLASATGVRAQQVAAPPLGQAAAYGLLSGGNISTSNSAGGPLPVRVLGRAGAQAEISPDVQATADVYALASGTVPGALTDAQQASAYCTNLGGNSLGGQLDGQTLGSGAYQVAGDATLGASAILTLTGDTATIIVLNVAGNVDLDKQAQVVLDGVLPGHVFWNVSGKVRLLAGSLPAGIVLAGGPSR